VSEVAEAEGAVPPPNPTTHAADIDRAARPVESGREAAAPERCTDTADIDRVAPPVGAARAARATAPIPRAHPLDNAVWHSLTTEQRHLAERDATGAAARYRPELSPFHSVDVLGDDGWAALAALAGPDEVIVLFRDEIGMPPPGWTVLFAGDGHQMIAPDDLPPMPGFDGELRPITEDDLDEAIALVALTKPGPFRPRTVDLGGYVGVFRDGRLLAMAGERMHLSGYAEVSAVCTHPDAQGRGLAAVVTLHVATQIQARGETPFLHVAVGNDNAVRLYERLGFTHRRLTQFQAIRTPSNGGPS
jgi:ribosomal protein S18 acetylase RimI-like enzyme